MPSKSPTLPVTTLTSELRPTIHLTQIIPLLNAYHFTYESSYTLYFPLLPLPLSVLLNSPFFSPYLPPAHTTRGLRDPLAFATTSSDTGGAKRNDVFNVLATSLIWQIVLGVKYLEEKGVAHRDLKPDNVVIGPGGEVVSRTYVESRGHLKKLT